MGIVFHLWDLTFFAMGLLTAWAMIKGLDL